MRRLLISGVLAAALCGACSHPKFITHMTHRDSDKTFKAVTYQDQTFSTPLWGAVKCNMADDGALSQCRVMTFNWNY